MRIDKELIEQLLYEGESDELDFKSEQYQFEEADIGKKSELLKDVLAFANSWRRTDAYILIGVRDGRGERAKIVGVKEHIDDAALQQFINGKTQKHVTFSYTPIKFEEKDIAVIHIPLQERPFYLNNQYGPLKAKTIYVRRGSATEEASPDEIARMGHSYKKERPGFDLQFCDEGKDLLGLEQRFKITNIIFPEDIPDYSPEIIGGISDYYHKKAAYLHKLFVTQSIYFVMFNSGNANANNVVVQILINDPGHELYVLDEYGFPRRPIAHYIVGVTRAMANNIYHDVTVEKITPGWEVQINLGTIQPKQKLYSKSKLFIGSPSDKEINLEAHIFADDLAEPVTTELLIVAEVEQKEATVEELMNFPLPE